MRRYTHCVPAADREQIDPQLLDLVQDFGQRAVEAIRGVANSDCDSFQSYWPTLRAYIPCSRSTLARARECISACRSCRMCCNPSHQRLHELLQRAGGLDRRCSASEAGTLGVGPRRTLGLREFSQSFLSPFRHSLKARWET